MKPVRVRFAPSPTGYLHIGGLRTALYDFLFAKSQNGTFILRIEDTDQKRFVADSFKSILESLAWAGLEYQEGPMLIKGEVKEVGDYGPYMQSARLDLYRKHCRELLDKKQAYRCFCTEERLDAMRNEQTAAKQQPMYDGLCRKLSVDAVEEKLKTGQPHVVRMVIPKDRTVVFRDLVRGEISFETSTVDDQVLLKSDGFPTYHLASVIDDHLMRISHVLRAEEWLSSTPKNLLLYEAFGWEAPEFAHLPQLLNPDRTKLSKRQGDVSVLDYKKAGYLPEAVVNFIALLGWTPKEGTEIFSLAELIQLFDITKIAKAGSIFNREKLDWYNGQYLRSMKLEEFEKRLQPFLADGKIDLAALASVPKALEVARERAITLKDATESLRGLLGEVKLTKEKLLGPKISSEIGKKALNGMLETLTKFAEQWQEGALKVKIKTWIETSGLSNGEVLWPLRVALSGAEKSPPPFALLEIYGREESLKRLQSAIMLVS